MMKRLANLFLLACLGIISISLMVVIFWLVYPYKTADIVEPIAILNSNKEVAQGEKIVMEIKITKYNLYPVRTDNSILCDNGRIYIINSTMPKGSASLPVGTFTRTQDSYSLPLDAEPGALCHFQFQNTYQVNPIRTIIKKWESEEFKVIKGVEQ